MLSNHIFLFFWSLLSLVPYLNADSNCSSQVLGLVREIPLQVNPTYFMRVDTNTSKIFISGDCVISLTTGNCISRGRTWEPYPISGSDLLTIPHCNDNMSMCFYLQSTFQNQINSQPVFVDTEMKGFYQSIGFLDKNKDTSKIRVISYYGVFRDYSIVDNQVKPENAVINYCPGVDLKLPMISKNGQIISGWDLEKEKTIFYDLKSSGECKEKFNLDFMIGKADFSFDGTFAAFHVSSDSSGNISDALDLTQQIFIMNIETRKIHKISFGNDNIYYPHFGENGLLYALKLDKNTDRYLVLEIDPIKAIYGADTEGSVCIDCTAERQSQLFGHSCQAPTTPQE